MGYWVIDYYLINFEPLFKRETWNRSLYAQESFEWK